MWRFIQWSSLFRRKPSKELAQNGRGVKRAARRSSKFLPRLAARIRALRAFEDDMASEFEFHVEARTTDLMHSGLSEQAARRAARLEFGSGQGYREECRSSLRLNWLDECRRNIQVGARLLRKSPGFSSAAILSLALGIGANTLVFSVLNSLLLQPLPIENPKQVVFVEARGGSTYSFPAYRDMRDQNSTFAGLAGYRISPMNMELGGNATRTWGYLATGNYFDVLGVRPAAGRFFHQADDVRAGASPFAVLSYESWQMRFGGDRRIVGQTVKIDGMPFTVLGVAPNGFHGTELFYWPELWVPMMMEPQIERGNPWLDNRYTWNTLVLGRLKAGVSAGTASADLNKIAKLLGKRYPVSDAGVQVRLAQPGLMGSALRGPVRAFAAGVFTLATLVLLTACVNLAGLMLARAADRQREMAIRLSIGAGRARIVLQSITESMLLAVVGGLAGCVLATVLSRMLSQWRAPLDFPAQFDVSPRWPVFAFALLISVATGALFGLGPALKLSRADVNGVLKGGRMSPPMFRRGFHWHSGIC
jgi:macrolide transport system ATP-binding/permease protein